MEFDIRFLDKESRTALQNAIDGVNRACMDDPGAWNYVSEGKLIQAYKDSGRKPRDPVAQTIFNEMEKERHSGYTAYWTVSAVTRVAKDYPKWRDEILVYSLDTMKKDLISFIERRYEDKFPEEDEVDWFVQKEKVLHDLEYSYLARHVLSDQDRNILQFLLKMESVSHLGNEVLFDQIEEQLQLL